MKNSGEMQKLRKKWIAALESGKYQKMQGWGDASLTTCVMGVAKAVLIKEGVLLSTSGAMESGSGHKMGLSFAETQELIGENDGSSTSFKEFAKILRCAERDSKKSILSVLKRRKAAKLS